MPDRITLNKEIDKMKKLMLIAALLMPLTTFADPGEHREHREHHEHYEGGNGAGWFLGGLILGGIIAHEAEDHHYYDEQGYEVRRETVCVNVPYAYDRWGNVISFTQQCHEEWVRVIRGN
jgi:hypothetical protein